MKERQAESTLFNIGFYPVKFLGESYKLGFRGLFST
jgi:hypothetical protein